MILTDDDIYNWAQADNVFPFNRENVNPASLDLCLGNEYRDFLYPDDIVTVPLDGKISIYKTSSLYDWAHLKLNPSFKRMFGRNMKHVPSAILAITEEWIRLQDDLAAEVKIKTSPTRLGLNNSLADWCDPGFEGILTLLFSCHRTLHLNVGMRICQLVIHKLHKPVTRSYKVTGHYNKQEHPGVVWNGYNI